MSAEVFSTKWPWQGFDSAEFATFVQTQAHALTGVQKEWASLFQKASGDWRARTTLEREMTAELTGKLSASKTLPDAAAAYQEWMARHFELMTKDGQKFLADSQVFLNSMNRFLPYGGGRDPGT